VYDDIAAKRRTTRYLHSKAVLVEAVTELAVPRVMSNLSD
jgi:hypothetical protein